MNVLTNASLLCVRFAVFGLALAALTACGGNPMTIAKERDRADEKRKDAEKDNQELEQQNALLKALVKNTITTTNSVWVLASVTSFHQEATRVCNDIEFTLPTAQQLQEFKAEVADVYPNWQEVDLGRIFVQETPQDQNELFGFGLCRRDRTHPFIEEIDATRS